MWGKLDCTWAVGLGNVGAIRLHLGLGTGKCGGNYTAPGPWDWEMWGQLDCTWAVGLGNVGVIRLHLGRGTGKCGGN